MLLFSSKACVNTFLPCISTKVTTVLLVIEPLITTSLGDAVE